MDLNALRLFVAAARAGSLSEAARRTSVPLATFSRRVRSLEADLGVRLVERGPRGLALTPFGNQLLADVADPLEALASAEERLHDASGITGTLRLSVPPNFEPMWGIIAEFGRRHPTVGFDVFVTARRVDLVADGVDLALRIGHAGSSAYVGRTLARYRHRLVASSGFLTRHQIDAPADLGGVPTGCWPTTGPPTWTLAGESHALEPMVTTNDYLHLRELALAGLLVTELPPFLAKDALSDGRLVEVLPDSPMPTTQVRALVVERRAMPPLVRHFLDLLGEALPAALGEDPTDAGTGAP